MLSDIIKQNPQLAWALVQREECERSFYDFVKRAWSSVESTPYQDSWHVRILCERLELIANGTIKRLLVNLPPRCGKTTIISVCFPVWVWLQHKKRITCGLGTNFLCASYGERLTLENAEKCRKLLYSKWFQSMWGDRIKLDPNKNTKSAFGVLGGGVRQSTSISGSLLGLGGEIIIVDDPHNTESVESEPERESSLRGWRELSGTRLNDPENGAIIVVMQRLHEEDVSGTIMSGPDYERWEHLMFPMRHDVNRHCWLDPRTEQNELMWPERFGEQAVRNMERELGPYMASGRLQQSPSPVGGGIIKSDWWKLWPPADWVVEEGQPLRFPDMSYIIAVCDTAYTEQKENDPSACVVLGVFKLHGLPKVMLMHAWAERLGFNDLLTKIIETCRKRKVDALLVEGKASGKSIIQEVRRICGAEEFSVIETIPEGDKVSRVHAVVPILAGGVVYAPDRQWAQSVIDQCSSFPKSKNDDLVDCISAGLGYLRKIGIALLSDEGAAQAYEEVVFRGNDVDPLYDV